MSVESIKKLVLCESEAKERLEKARREQSEMKAQARMDAETMVEDLRRQNGERLAQLEKEVEEHVKMVDERLRADMEANVAALENVKNRQKIIDALVERVCRANKE